MKISVPVLMMVEVEFDTEVDGEVVIPDRDQLVIRSHKAVVDTLHASEELVDEMLERITDATGWCIQALSMEVP